MENFTFTFPTKLYFGSGSLESLGKATKQHAKRVLIVTGKNHARESGLLSSVLENLSIRRVTAIHYDQISPNPLVSEIDEGARIANLKECEMILGVGGGSAMDAAKGIATVAKNGGSIWDYTEAGNFPRFSLPVGLVCTLAASGSEGNYWGVVTHDENRQKIAFICQGSQPIFSIVDPELTISTSREQTIDGAIDIICHALERYFTGKENTSLQDFFVRSIVKTAKENLEILLENPNYLDARTQLSWCSTMVLMGIVQAGVAGFPTLHAIEHPLSGKYAISHGRGLGILLPHYIRYQSKRSEIFKTRFCHLAQFLFERQDDFDGYFQSFLEWLSEIGMAQSLADFDINPADFPIFARQILNLKGAPLFSIPPLERDDIVAIYNASMKGLR